MNIFVQGGISGGGPCTGNGIRSGDDVQGLALVFPPCTVWPLSQQMIRSCEIHLPRGNASGGGGAQVGWEGEAKMADFPTEQALRAEQKHEDENRVQDREYYEGNFPPAPTMPARRDRGHLRYPEWSLPSLSFHVIYR